MNMFMKFVQGNGQPVWINPAHVLRFAPNGPEYTRVWMPSASGEFFSIKIPAEAFAAAVGATVETEREWTPAAA